MTATAAASPQLMRDRLLQAIDGQSNICNMVIVLEVISLLEKYPITKEALEETRLGKLINDVRKKTKNEDLAKRAKKLLRTWQKLIEPAKSDATSKGNGGAPWSSNGGAHPCVPAPAAAPLSGKTGPELKNRNDFHNCRSPTAEKQSNGKRKAALNESGRLLPAKRSKVTLHNKINNSKELPKNGISSGSEIFTESLLHAPLDRDESQEKDKTNKIPVYSVKPHLSAGYSKPLSTSMLIKASVLQQQARQEQAASGGQYRPKSPRNLSHGTPTPNQEGVVKHISPQPRSISSPAARPGAVDTPAHEPPLNTTRSADSDRPSGASPRSSSDSCCSDGAAVEDNGAFRNAKKRKHKFRSKNSPTDTDRQTRGDNAKPVRLKDRRLTFNPVTGQITPSFQKASPLEEEEAAAALAAHRAEPPWTQQSKQPAPVPPCPFQQTDWKELSRSEIIQSYLSQQSSVLTSSGSHAPGAHHFMTEYLRKDEHRTKEDKRTHVLVSELPARGLPGVNRELSEEDVRRLHTRRWPGVNGCSDTLGNWYDWTECISLDPHGDQSRLNILPYVCLD